MNRALALIKTDYKTLIFDLLVFAGITLVPAFSHMFSLPIYYIEPMRIMIILGAVHTSRKNSYILALAIPIISVMISGHPSVVKSLLIFSELSINVWLFFTLAGMFRNNFTAAFASIILSKMFYYAAKFLLLQTGLMEGGLVATPLYMQLIVTTALSVYAYFILRKRTA